MDTCGHILTEGSDFLNTESSNRLVTECFVSIPSGVTLPTTCTVFQLGHAWIWSETGIKVQNPEHIFRQARKLGLEPVILD